ncbi:MAG: site-specific tyrosine recombinase XerC [Woeseiaceae bacterium]
MPRWSERPAFGDPDDPRGFPVLLARYLEALAVRHCSVTTIASREHVVRLFAAWCVERGVERPGDATRAVLDRYQRWLFHHRSETGKALRLGTQHSRLLGVRLFFAWLAHERYLATDPASALVLPRKPPRLPTDTFSVAEVEEIFAVPDASTAVGLLDRAILETLYSTGIRRSELVKLDVHDLDVDRGWLVVRQGKGGKDRVVPIGERALAWVVRYLEEARAQLVVAPTEQALFVNAEGQRFAPGTLGARVRRILEQSGVRERVGSCHLFRHTCATLMLEGGADVRFIQEMLGHASLDSTQIYTRVSIQKLKAIHTATHPGAKLERRAATESETAPGS